MVAAGALRRPPLADRPDRKGHSDANEADSYEEASAPVEGGEDSSGLFRPAGPPCAALRPEAPRADLC
eukprot:2181361-Alexandrium_andersonii.AAC.1